MGQTYSSSGKNNRALSLLQMFQDTICQRSIINRLLIKRAIKSFQLICFNQSSLNIQWHINPNGSIAAIFAQIPCFLQMITDVIGIKYHFRILGHRFNRSYYIILLVAQLTHVKVTGSDSGFTFYLS